MFGATRVKQRLMAQGIEIHEGPNTLRISLGLGERFKYYTMLFLDSEWSWHLKTLVFRAHGPSRLKIYLWGGGGVQSQASGDQFEHQGSRRGGADVNLTVLLCQVVLCSGVFRLMI